MPIRKLLLPLTGAATAEAALSTALLVARQWNAHVQALHVRIDSREVAPLAGEGLSGAMIEDMMSATERESLDRAGLIRAMFDRCLAASPEITLADAAPGQSGTTASFLSMVGREEDVVAAQSRLADLTVVAHPESGDEVSSSDALHAVLFDSGRPVLIAPKRAPIAVGKRVCIAWNGTAESAAAVLGVLPWAQRADAVCILSSDSYQRRGPLAAELAAYLALHGIQAEFHGFRPIASVVGAGLLAAAAEFGADLVSMGAYSQSRLRQLILGGVTRHVLEHATLPVLMSR